MTWFNLTFAFKEILASSKMTQLDENFDALANGDSGAPSIQHDALASDIDASDINFTASDSDTVEGLTVAQLQAQQLAFAIIF